MMENLVNTWREAWSAEPETTPSDFPFGLVSLAGGTSEGNGNSMGAFRYAQTGNTGFGWDMQGSVPNTFVAQAFDTGDPCSGGNQCCTNSKDAQGGWPCMSGEAPYTGQFMGGIHPRVKKIVGTRLAKAARAIAYGDKKQIWSGPILESCVVQGGSIQLTFQEDKLLDDTIMVLQDTVSQVDVGGAWQWTPDMLQLVSQMMPQSPMEVQLNGNTTGTLDDGVWVPVGLHPKCNPTGRDSPSPGQGECSLNTTTGAKLPGWNIVTVDVGSFRNAMANITGIRCVTNSPHPLRFVLTRE